MKFDLINKPHHKIYSILNVTPLPLNRDTIISPIPEEGVKTPEISGIDLRFNSILSADSDNIFAVAAYPGS